MRKPVRDPKLPPLPGAPPIEVLFDGTCRYCAREIAFYRRASDPGAVTWTDISQGHDAPVAGIARDAALARLHVIDARGVPVSGSRAFVLIWRQVPRLRLLAAVFALPPFSWVLAAGYEAFLVGHRKARRRAKYDRHGMPETNRNFIDAVALDANVGQGEKHAE